MKKKGGSSAWVALWLLAMMGASPGLARGAADERGENLIERAMKARIPFVANQGQITNEAIRFYADVLGGTVFVTDNGEIIYSLRIAQENRTETNLGSSFGPKVISAETLRKGWVLKESFVGASCRAPEGVKPFPAKISFFVGSNPKRWKTGLPAFESLDFGEIYHGIELRLNLFGRTVEKVFTVKPGATVETISLQIDGAQQLRLNDRGELELETGIGVVRFTKPVAFQMEDGHRRPVEVTYHTKGKRYGFKVGNYDRSKPLVIDPFFASTLLGGTGSEGASSLALDSQGNLYVSGSTTSHDFPVTEDAYDPDSPGGYSWTYDVFISKFDPDLTRLLASTFLGGRNSDEAVSVRVDRFDNVFVAGRTTSADFPVTPGTYDTGYHGSWDIFISKLDSNLTTLLASTFLGGSEKDLISSLVVSETGEVSIGGYTRSQDYPVTPGAYLTTPDTSSGNVGFISKMTADLSTLLASTFLPGSIAENGLFVAVGDQGEIYAAGGTYRADFPVTPGAFDPTHNGEFDVFVMKFDPGLETLLASTFLGGLSDEIPAALGIDGSGNIFVGGQTSSPNFPTTAGSYQNVLYYYCRWHDIGFISKLDRNLTTLLASTYLEDGLTRPARITSLAPDRWGNLFVAGETTSEDFPTTPGVYDLTYNGNTDIFVSKFDTNLSQLLASTFVGGSDNDKGRALLVSESGHIYVAGETDSPDFPVPEGAFSRQLKNKDAFVFRLSEDLSVPGGNPEIKVMPARIDFGTVTVGTTSLVKTLTISNGSAGTDLLIHSATLAGAHASEFDLYSNTCTEKILKPSEKCYIQIGFNPQTPGPKSAAATLVSNDLDRPVFEVELIGTAEISDLVLVPSSMDFGEVLIGKFSDQILFISNNGPGLLVLGVIEDPSPPFAKAVDHCSDHVLFPNERCPVLIRFAPMWKGTFSSSLPIPSNDLDEGEVVLSLNGKGIVNDIEVAPAMVDFGNIPAGHASDQAVMIKNVEAGPLTIEGFGPLLTPFSLAGGTCQGGTVLLGEESCSVVIRFSPVVAGSFSSEFTIRSDDRDERVVTVPLRGASGPDLKGEWLSVAERCKGVGSEGKCKIDTAFEIRNVGSQDASSQITFYLSEDMKADSIRILLKRVGTGRMKAGMSRVKKGSYSLPPGMRASGKYIMAIIDEENAVREADEGNNVAWYSIP